MTAAVNLTPEECAALRSLDANPKNMRKADGRTWLGKMQKRLLHLGLLSYGPDERYNWRDAGRRALEEVR